jgi:hypothetical protein
MANRKLAALAAAGNESSLPRIFTKCALKWDRYRMAAFRRSPWFPQPITTDCDALRAQKHIIWESS